MELRWRGLWHWKVNLDGRRVSGWATTKRKARDKATAWIVWWEGQAD